MEVSSWENHLFLWVIFHSKPLVITRGYIVILQLDGPGLGERHISVPFEVQDVEFQEWLVISHRWVQKIISQ